MKNKSKNIFLHYLIVTLGFVLFSCSSQNLLDDKHHDFKLLYMDTLFFGQYDVLKFLGIDSNSYYVLSRKNDFKKTDSIYSLEIGKIYKLRIIEYKKKPKLEVRIGHEVLKTFHIDGDLFLNKGQIVQPVYYSPDIISHYYIYSK
ncbi:MAG: hypothetical protein L0Y79_10905 [Chlorobi bacterium]|nr:hypothetical protein [Chlorobiota bacterium]MCI0715566.1 hypothetical protein [Chlorobiota bacterium]